MKVETKLQKVLDDFTLFSKNFIFITDNENQVVKFDLNEAQLEINDLMKKNRFIIIGKARQSGISTFTLGRALWRALTMPNENILIVSYKGDSAKALFDKLKQMNEFLPRDKYPSIFPNVKRKIVVNCYSQMGVGFHQLQQGVSRLDVDQLIPIFIFLNMPFTLVKNHNSYQLNNH